MGSSHPWKESRSVSIGKILGIWFVAVLLVNPRFAAQKMEASLKFLEATRGTGLKSQMESLSVYISRDAPCPRTSKRALSPLIEIMLTCRSDSSISAALPNRNTQTKTDKTIRRFFEERDECGSRAESIHGRAHS
jgi:hypothetical protein